MELPEGGIELELLHHLKAILERHVEAAPHLLRHIAEATLARLDLLVEDVPPLGAAAVLVKQQVACVLQCNGAIKVWVAAVSRNAGTQPGGGYRPLKMMTSRFGMVLKSLVSTGLAGIRRSCTLTPPVLGLVGSILGESFPVGWGAMAEAGRERLGWRVIRADGGAWWRRRGAKQQTGSRQADTPPAR